MAAGIDVKAAVAAFCDLGAEAEHARSREALSIALRDGHITLLSLLCLMDGQLTSAENVTRSRSVLLLSEVRAPSLRPLNL